MNVRKRGLALLMCICMIFTLLPFSVLADATTQDVVYGKYDSTGTTWTKDNSLTAENDAYKNDKTGANIKYSKEAKPVAGEADTYDITLKIESTTTKTSPGASAVVLVIDQSYSMNCCATCNNDEHNYNFVYQHAVGCKTGHTGKVNYEDTRLKAAKDAAKQFADNYAATGSERYLSVVSFCEYSKYLNFGNYFNAIYWVDVSNEKDLKTFKDKIDTIKLDSGTNLSAGLDKAYNLFNNDTVKNISSRYTVVLTDGKPNYPDNSAKAAEDSADNLKTKAKSEVYTVCVGAEDTPFNGTTVGEFLKEKIASKKTGKVYAYNIITKEQLFAAFTAIFADIQLGLSSGFTVNDPMGANIVLQSQSITDAVIDNNGFVWTPTTPSEIVAGENGAKTYIYTVTYRVKLNTSAEGFVDGKYYPTNDDTTLKFKDGKNADGSDNNVTLQFNVPGVKGKAPTYTVMYKPGDHGTLNDADTNGNVVTSGLKKGDNTPAEPIVTPAYGYEFTGWNPARADKVAGDATYVAQYRELNNLSYTIEHYWIGDKTQTIRDNIVKNDAKLGDTKTVGPEAAAYIDGYTIMPTQTENSTEITATSDKVIKLYYYKNVTVTPNNASKIYGDDDPAKFTATVSGLINETDSLTYDFTRALGEDVGGYEIHKSTGDEIQGCYKVTYETGVFNITKRDVTFTGETGTKPYTGSTIELTDITNVGLLKVHSASNLTYSASGINVGGPYNGEFSVKAEDVKIIDAENNDVSRNYNVTLVPGSLTIVKANAVIVKITGKTDTKVYNGLQQTFTGYDVVIENDPNNVYKKTDFSLKSGVDVTASGTNVGEYKMGLTADSFVNNNTNFDVKFVIVKDGSLTITKRPLTIIGESSDPSEITYDGKTHEYIKWSLSPATDNSGLVPGHQITGITYLLTGKNAGDYTGKFSGDAKIMSGEEDVTANYSIERSPGKMKIVPADKIAVKIIGNHKEVWYNGQEQSVSGFTFEVADNTVTVELKAGHYAIAKGTNVKTYYMGLKSDDFTINHKNYKEVSVEIVDGYLTIKRHYTPNPPIMDEIIVEITGNSDSVVYDGTEHSVKGYTVKISDPRYTEADFTFTGKAEASGVNAGTYEMGLKAEQFKNTNARFTNVKFVIKADGVLTITPKELTITAGSKTEYGPTPVTCDEWTVSGLVAGDKVESVKITGIQSVPGSSPNVPSDAVIKNAKGEDVTKNYAIKYVNGTLTMLEVLNKEDHFNYIIGTPEGLSLPTANVTRAEVATIFFRLMTDDARAKFDSLDNNFSDVAKGKWYNRAISTLANAGIIKGDPAGTYRPGDPITRAEMAAIIARFGDFKEGGKTFNDISGHWAQKYIELAASNGWINGNPDGTFKPNNNITRAETVAMINRVLDRQTKDVSDLLPVSQMTNWSDNMDTAKWYYRDMQEATNNHKAERVGNSIYEKWTEKLPDIDWASYQI